MKTLNPNDFGKKIFVEECKKVRIDDLLRVCRAQLKKLALDVEITELGMKIDLATSKTRFNGTRFWFTCPLCNKRAGVLFHHPLSGEIGCRKCLNLEYLKKYKTNAYTTKSGIPQ